MVHYRGTSRSINRPAAEVFEIVGTHAFEYHPQWGGASMVFVKPLELVGLGEIRRRCRL